MIGAVIVLAGIDGIPGRFAADAAEESPALWSLSPVVPADPPAVAGPHWCRTLVDPWVLASLEAAGLAPSPEADRRVLARRLSYDLTGLPPEPEVVEGFLADSAPDACERFVDRLLASPSFGEHWSVLWLNLMRYAEDQAHQVGNDTQHFYPNAHHYREWVISALNRDLAFDEFVRLQLAADLMPDVPATDLPALGFLGLGPKYYGRGMLSVKADEWEDRVDVVSRGLLGLTLACAKCHDHKSDPLRMDDYYALAGVFASTELVNQPYQCDESALSEEERKKNLHTIHIVKDGEVKDLNLFLRGDVEQKGPVVPRRFPAVLGGSPSRPYQQGSGRLELANDIVDPSNPLTARVFVNRVWRQLMGRGIVETPSNFGALGERPTHPELLDALASDFMANGWSIKHLVRTIVGSATYRQSSLARPDALALDEGNRLYWRMNRKRLSAEMVRDTLLAVGGNLDPAAGRSLEIDDPANRRRTVYARVSRLELDSYLQQFDFPDPNIHCAKRARTTTPTQKLYLLNNPFVIDQAAAVAARVADEAGDRPESWTHRLFERVLARPPARDEIVLAREFLSNSPTDETPSPDPAATRHQFAQAVLVSNEFLYVD